MSVFRSPSILLLVAAVVGSSFVVYAQLGGPSGIRIPYQGRLEVGGVPVNGPHDFRFSIYNSATGGTRAPALKTARW